MEKTNPPKKHIISILKIDEKFMFFFKHKNKKFLCRIPQTGRNFSRFTGHYGFFLLLPKTAADWVNLGYLSSSASHTVCRAGEPFPEPQQNRASPAHLEMGA